MKVRAAQNMEDIDKMVELGALMHAESRFARYEFNSEKLRAYGAMALQRPDDWGVFLAEDADGQVLAMIAVFRSPFYFSMEDHKASDLALYVHPGKRGGLAAARCVQAVEEWALRNGVRTLEFGITAGIDNERAERFYAGLGYTRTAPIMVKEIA